MDKAKRRRLEAAGWTVGSTAEFLALSPEEMAYIELKANLCDALKERRKARGFSQKALAAAVGLSESRLTRIEENDPGVTIDLLIRALFALGVSTNELVKIIGAQADCHQSG